MKPSWNLTLLALLLATFAFAPRAQAAPFIYANSIVNTGLTDAGGDIYAFELWVDADDGLGISIVLDITISNATSIHQQRPFGAVDVLDQSTADTWDGFPGANYLKAEDTWYDDTDYGLGNHQWFPQTVVSEAGGVVYYHLNSWPGSSVDQEWFAMVLSSSDLDIVGSTWREAVQNPINQTIPIPEPSSALLIGCGLVGLALRRRI